MMTIQQAFLKFLDDRTVYCADRTIAGYREHFNRFREYLAAVHAPADQLQFAQLPPDVNLYAGFIRYLRQRASSSGLSNTSIRSYARSAKVFLNWCNLQGYCSDYVKGVKLPKDDAAPQLPLSSAEVLQIDLTFARKTEKGLRNYCILHLMLDCGLRSQEVRHLRIEDIDQERQLIHIVRSKEDKTRFTLIPDFLIQQIKNYLWISKRGKGLLFLSLRSDVGLSENAVKQLFAQIRKDSGIKRLHAHLLRHTFAVSYLLGGGNLEFLRVFLGHYDYSVTKVYLSMAAQMRMLGIDVYKLDPIFFRNGY